MPSFQDSALIVVIALLLFGPKGMAKLARELGKLMGEFRRASADFRLQMDEEFRISEQEDQQKKIAAMEAAAPAPAAFPAEDIPEPEHPHTPVFAEPAMVTAQPEAISEHSIDARPPAPLPIASSGDLHMMPPSTGLPQARARRTAPEPPLPVESHGLGGIFDSIPPARGEDEPATVEASRG